MLSEAFRDRPDLQLILAAARPSVSHETSERIRTLVGQQTDWSGVLRQASEHGVRPLLYRSLQSTCPERIPDAVLAELLSFIRSDVAHNLSQNAELGRLLKGLDERGVSAIPFKGAILADWAFADGSLRESGDIDIVIRKRHTRAAATFLLTQGYRSRSGGLESKLENTTDDNLGRYLRFDRIDGLASVDLQCSLEAPHFRAAPHNLEAEQALLGAMLVNNEAHDRVSGFLQPIHFYDPLHAQIYETSAKLIAAGRELENQLVQSAADDVAAPVWSGESAAALVEQKFRELKAALNSGRKRST